MAFGFRGVSNNAAVRTVSSLTSPAEVASSSSLSSVRSALNGEVNVRKIEVAMMVKVPDLWVMAVATSLDQSFEGEQYTYNDLPQRVVNERKQIIATDAITFADFKAPESPEWDDKLALLEYTGLSDTAAEFSVSKLSAANSCQEDSAPVVGRFTATPVYASSDTSKTGAIEAVLISSDMLNGKTAINEWSMTAFQSGYVAIYILTDPQEDGRRRPVLLGSLLTETPELDWNQKLSTALRQLIKPEEELRRAEEAYKTSELRVDLDLSEGQEGPLTDLLKNAERGAKESVLMTLRDRQYFVSAVQAPPDLINFVPTSDRHDSVFLVRGVWTGADNPTRALRIRSMIVILILALTIKIVGGFFVWRRVAGPLQHALLGIRAMLAGLPVETVKKRVQRVESIGLQIEPFPLTKDSVAFCWFILKYERILFDTETKEEKFFVRLLKKQYPELLQRKIVRPWCCLCSKCGGIEEIANERGDSVRNNFTPKSKRLHHPSFFPAKQESASSHSSSHREAQEDSRLATGRRIVRGEETEQGEALALEVFEPDASRPVGTHPVSSTDQTKGQFRRGSSRLPGSRPRLEKSRSHTRFFTLPVRTTSPDAGGGQENTGHLHIVEGFAHTPLPARSSARVSCPMFEFPPQDPHADRQSPSHTEEGRPNGPAPQISQTPQTPQATERSEDRKTNALHAPVLVSNLPQTPKSTDRSERRADRSQNPFLSLIMHHEEDEPPPSDGGNSVGEEV
uniref:Uncharacterized protein n=1 Tax=Chromera velia CCMP2878 TaxID=1169474 RepID=A0A0G4G2E9_9ALVE|mmetsp:Transcript_38691/g.76064  ORF Transcript_38691/g.76064 Transcript_38691/m.76064 type:complete len:739 (+) Transcript_38691:300-2516(+)|eukprot:Cvel_4057.t1-p1 / transcript=Cvel_4057.t1 / gene=Cvel_4057 / organism=Chromera_velia_CCMP2878 / gene_product=hypothetical protein / transcript_product=hypothetical protein / location=Cvel_scaffold173:297-4806(+) / protein_length=738 / sequence_SO=supercontig / SO=protein_coding / is_pseudo=false